MKALEIRPHPGIDNPDAAFFIGDLLSASMPAENAGEGRFCISFMMYASWESLHVDSGDSSLYSSFCKRQEGLS